MPWNSEGAPKTSTNVPGESEDVPRTLSNVPGVSEDRAEDVVQRALGFRRRAKNFKINMSSNFFSYICVGILLHDKSDSFDERYGKLQKSLVTANFRELLKVIFIFGLFFIFFNFFCSYDMHCTSFRNHNLCNLQGPTPRLTSKKLD